MVEEGLCRCCAARVRATGVAFSAKVRRKEHGGRMSEEAEVTMRLRVVRFLVDGLFDARFQFFCAAAAARTQKQKDAFAQAQIALKAKREQKKKEDLEYENAKLTKSC